MAWLHRNTAAQIANVCTGEAVSIRHLAVLLAEALDRTPAIEQGPARPGDIRHSRGAPDHAASLLGLRASYRLAEGLRATLASMREAAPGLLATP